MWRAAISAVLSFVTGSKALLVAGGVALATCLGFYTYAQYWRAEASAARAALAHKEAELELAIGQAKVLAESLKACSAGAEEMRRLGAEAKAAMSELLAKARKLAGPRERTIERIERIIRDPAQPGEGCDWAWDQLEAEHRKARAAP